jgi:cholesterol transport system auxiliary component
MRSLLLLLAGCALTASNPPPDVHYFSPESPRIAKQTTAHDAPLRLARLELSSHLRARIVYRTSDVELAMYETRRWTEHPDAYVRRALVRSLYEDRPFVMALGHAAPTLAVTVLAFEEVRVPRHVGRVTLRFVLSNEQTAIASDEVSVDELVRGPSFDDVVRAIGRATDLAASEVADRVSARTVLSREVTP